MGLSYGISTEIIHASPLLHLRRMVVLGPQTLVARPKIFPFVFKCRMALYSTSRFIPTVAVVLVVDLDHLGL